ncbi:5-formyltetrahydrofolate cyclo-ligase [Chryseobacterium sp.]|uniref:5-formyltetrahydrofolate cyclo-ligase n=1 Tax=Chryseobacterium sp. TaxID=1871047 RepID=UPI0025C54CF5|nr:5-formyltetrahydrofolate cyclo-ligase [Chryseobacterium sp.]
MQKAELRKIYLEKRKALSHDEASFLSEKIFQNFIHFFKPLTGQKVHVFIPIKKFKEVDTHLFINYFWTHGIRVFVPKIVNERLISVEIFKDSEFETHSWGISEPVSNEDSGEIYFDYIITPLLYCDNKGNRIGYGKGFYDNFFQCISSDSVKVGVNYFNPRETIDNVWENDISLDYLATSTDVLSFLGGKE